MNDIKSKIDVIIFVDDFYIKVAQDELLGPIFKDVVSAGSWPCHLERMYSFWNTVLFGAVDYRGNPFSKHRELPIDATHFDRWISLFTKTIETNFQGPKAEEAKLRAFKMGLMFQSKLENLRNSNYNSIM